jgi:hypothetical protein
VGDHGLHFVRGVVDHHVDASDRVERPRYLTKKVFDEECKNGNTEIGGIKVGFLMS